MFEQIEIEELSSYDQEDLDKLAFIEMNKEQEEIKDIISDIDWVQIKK